MEVWIQHLMTQSLQWALFAVAVVTFFESLALVGLVLPGTVMMASLGALIGSGKIGLYPAWAAGCAGCLLGDWISFYIGWRFKGPLHRWKYLQKHRKLLDKIEHALNDHSVATILIGRFVGPTRPLVPMLAGMLELPVKKFLPANIIGCILWPPVYLLPGILAGVAIDAPHTAQSSDFKWLLLAEAVLIWLAAWLGWRWFRSIRKKIAPASGLLSAKNLRWLAPLMIVAAVAGFVALQFHPMMPDFRHLLWRVFIA